MSKVMVVDDDETILKLIKMRLEVEGYTVSTASSAEAALELARGETFDVALLDYKLADKNGITLMTDLFQLNPEMPVIILTAYGTIKGAVEAMKKGAYGYIAKPFDYEELLLQIRNCSEKSGLSKEVKRLRDLVEERYGFENIIGKSESITKLLEQVAQAAQVDSFVYISGESGTGKELVAKSLHLACSRKNSSFVAVNCAAIPETLLESELFGYEKGAFQKLMAYDWPGNVRELENCVESAVAMTDKKVISEDLVLKGKAASPSGPMAFKHAKTEFERQYLIHLMEITEGNVSQAAKLAGKYRADLYELLKKHELDPEKFRSSSQ